VGAGQADRPLDALVDVEERASLLAVAPHLDFTAILCAGYFAAKGCWRFFATPFPSAFRAKNVVITRHAYFHAVVAREGEVEALAEQLFPAVFAVRSRRVGGVFCAVGVVRIFLI